MSKTRDYLVGYGKPPEHSRFPKGVSGNPKGRPKGKKNMHTIIHETLFELVRIQQNGKERTVPAVEAIVLRLCSNALGGDHRSAMAALKLAASIGSVDEAGVAETVANPLDEQSLFAVMREFLDYTTPPAAECTYSSDAGGAETSADCEGEDQ